MIETIVKTLWPDWEIEDEIGAGAYGTVYKANYVGGDELPDQTESVAAIKVIEVPANSTEARELKNMYPAEADLTSYLENIVTEMFGEIQSLETLKNNPNVVQIRDCIVWEDKANFQWRLLIRMEYLQPFTEYLYEHEMSEHDVIRLGIDICNALVECESKGIIHRDIKPQNIMVTADGRFKLGDFGVAKNTYLKNNTMSIKGSYSYMAPETFRAQQYTAKVDQYALGLVLYQLLNHNRDPFVPLDKQLVNGRDKEQALARRVKGDPLEAPVQASERMAKIILRACAYDPDQRFAHIKDMRKQLQVLYGLKPVLRGESASCSRCGYPIKAGQNVCPQCKEPVFLIHEPDNRGGSRPVPDKNKSSGRTQPSVRGERRGGRRHFKIILPALAVVLLIAGIVFLKRDADTGPKEKTEVSKVTELQPKEENSKINSSDKSIHLDKYKWEVKDGYLYTYVTVNNNTGKKIPYKKMVLRIKVKFDEQTTRTIELSYDLANVADNKVTEISARASFNAMKVSEDQSIQSVTRVSEPEFK